MSDHDFVFALDLSDPARFDAMLAEVARAVFGHVGYPADAAGELASALQTAVAKVTGGGRRCAVRFEAHAGQLRLSISCGGGAEWETARPLP